jgi:heme oxygenase
VSDRLLHALREATASRHAELDQSLPLAAPGLTLERYVAFLRGSLAALEDLEPAIAPLCWRPELRRCACLRHDLEELGAPPTASPEIEASPAPAGRADLLGCAYVIEGSTLGGLVLAERVERALATHATSYLRLRGADTARAWRAFLAVLDEQDADMTEADRDRACNAARATFDRYREALLAHAAHAVH